MGFAARRLPLASAGADRFVLELPSDLARIGEAVEAVVDCCRVHGPLDGRARFRLRTVAAEAIANAMCYGNRNDPARLVTVAVEVHREQILLTVSDEGEGFDPAGVCDMAQLSEAECHEATRGRGLYMIARLAEQVRFNDRGNTIWMTLPRH
jgi:anti-sigma regulatory factor (Ser/Thr protein kinase)